MASKPGRAKAGRRKGKDAKTTDGPSVAAHPRASASVRRAKGFGGLAGFTLAALLSHRAGLPASVVLERALVAGVGGYLLAWACAVTVWRSLVLAEVRAVVELRTQLNSAQPTDPLVRSRDEGQPVPAAAMTAGE